MRPTFLLLIVDQAVIRDVIGNSLGLKQHQRFDPPNLNLPKLMSLSGEKYLRKGMETVQTSLIAELILAVDEEAGKRGLTKGSFRFGLSSLNSRLFQL